MPENSDSFTGNTKYPAREILQAMESVRPMLGRVALQALINDLELSGLHLHDEGKSYTLNEIQSALKMTFGEASILFIDRIRDTLEGSK